MSSSDASIFVIPTPSFSVILRLLLSVIPELLFLYIILGLDPRIQAKKSSIFLALPLRGEVGAQAPGEGDNTQLTAACFVTDTRDCSGDEFAGNNADDDNVHGAPGGGDDYDLDNKKRCIEEGYTMTFCPEGYEALNFCPYDNTYFERCRKLCPSDYVTCEPPYYGVDEVGRPNGKTTPMEFVCPKSPEYI